MGGSPGRDEGPAGRTVPPAAGPKDNGLIFSRRYGGCRVVWLYGCAKDVAITEAAPVVTNGRPVSSAIIFAISTCHSWVRPCNLAPSHFVGPQGAYYMYTWSNRECGVIAISYRVVIG